MKASELKAKHAGEMAELQEAYNLLQTENENRGKLIEQQRLAFEQKLLALESQRQEAKAEGHKYRLLWEEAKDSCAGMEVRLSAALNGAEHAASRIEELENELRKLKASIRDAETYP